MKTFFKIVIGIIRIIIYNLLIIYMEIKKIKKINLNWKRNNVVKVKLKIKNVKNNKMHS